MGELAEPRRAALPIVAAVGGAIVPALIFLGFNAGQPGMGGWGIPMATDIAFALGVLALVGSRVPTPLKVFLTTLAIVDDLIAIVVIAVVYTDSLDLVGVGIELAFLAALVAANRLGVRHLSVYGVLGVGLWLGVLASGVHATIAGVLMALTVPVSVGARPHDGRPTRSPLIELEHRLHPWSAFLIVPLFALANAGVTLTGDPSQLAEPLTLGILVGLVLGKPLGILASAWLVGRMTGVGLPEGTTRAQLLATGVLAGIGFTMSLFIAELAELGADGLHEAKLGILAASLVAGVAGWVLMRRATPQGAP
jgi:NhaA family Na+:H+ antiporter